MKSLITIILFLFSFFSYGQKYTLLEINAKWNSVNNVELPKIPGVSNQFAFLEDQNSDLKSKIKAVPIVVLYKDNKPVHQWTANLSFKLVLTEQEIRKVLLEVSKN